MRSSWLASATKRRTFCSLCSRADSADATWPSMRLNAVPRRPTSVRSSSTGTRSAERDVAAVEVQLGHALRGRGDLGERAERAPHDGRADDEREHEADDRHDRDRECELRRGRRSPRRAAGPARTATSPHSGCDVAIARYSPSCRHVDRCAARRRPAPRRARRRWSAARSSTRPPSVMYPARVAAVLRDEPGERADRLPGHVQHEPRRVVGIAREPRRLSGDRHVRARARRVEAGVEALDRRAVEDGDARPRRRRRSRRRAARPR